MAKQQSRIDWLKDGDHNTALFHAKTRERAHSNSIKSLLRPDGSVRMEVLPTGKVPVGTLPCWVRVRYRILPAGKGTGIKFYPRVTV
jgi:hypothetical protein